MIIRTCTCVCVVGVVVGGTLLSHPGEMGNDEYSGGTLADPTGFSNSVNARVGVASVVRRCGLLPAGEGSKREKSEDIWGERTVAPPIEGDNGWVEFWKAELVGVFWVDCGEVGPSGPSNRSSRFVLQVHT